MDEVGLARARRLPVEGEAEDQHHETGRRREGDGERRGRSPVRQRFVRRFNDGDQAERVLERPHRGVGAGAVGQRDLERARGGAEGGQRLRRTEHVEHGAPERLRVVRHAGDDGAVAIGDEHQPAALRRPRRQRMFERIGGPRRSRAGIAPRAVERQSELVAQCLDRLPRADDGLAALFEHLHHRADADGNEKSDDENRNGAAQQRLGAQQPAIGRLGDRLRQPLDRIGT
jgi:hypothetical protein